MTSLNFSQVILPYNWDNGHLFFAPCLSNEILLITGNNGHLLTIAKDQSNTLSMTKIIQLTKFPPNDWQVVYF